jgi:predicted amidohydrolase YtcJ
MRMRKRLAGILGGIAVAGLLSANSWAEETADLVFRNGPVYTVDAARSWASAVAVKGDRIIYVGTDDGVKPFIAPQTRIVELNGRMLLPGFEDSHVHPESAGIALSEVQLDPLQSKEQILAAVKSYADAHPAETWIRGFGWMEGAFLPTGLPTRQMLDQIVPDRPVFLFNNSGHAAWANSKALAIAGITAKTPDPANGRIERQQNGEPAGVLQEYATELVRSHMPEITAEAKTNALREALREMSKVGVTSIMDAFVQPDVADSYAVLYKRHELPVRVILCQGYDPGRDDEVQISEFIARRHAWPKGDLRATCVKIMLDGVPEHHTAAMLEPYSDSPEFGAGPLFVEPGRLKKLVTRLDAEGFQIHMHTIGDRAVHEALNAISAAQQANGTKDARPTLAHLDLIDLPDFPRFRELGVVANMTPLWSRGDDWETVFAPRVFGAERSQRLLQSLSLLNCGVVLAWGTDWPVTSMSPVEGLETAVTRRYLGGVDPSGKPDRSWLPGERLNLEQAIAAYTIAGAFLAHEEKVRGSIEPGKVADLVVLEKNLFMVPPLEIHSVATDMTVLNGRILFERHNR